MNNLALLRLFDASRPRDYRVQIIAPDGSVPHDAKFATRDEAKAWAKSHRGPRDLVMTRHTEPHLNN